MAKSWRNERKQGFYDPRCDLPYYGRPKTDGHVYRYEEMLPGGEIKAIIYLTPQNGVTVCGHIGQSPRD